MKLWDKGTELNTYIEEFTTAKDRVLDLKLAKWDVVGTIAHIEMLEKAGLLEKEELDRLVIELENILRQIRDGDFIMYEGVEDIHSQIEGMLTEKLGDVGKKVHSGRSRNDQVLVDLKLYFREEITLMLKGVEQLFETLQSRGRETSHLLMPGYTHMQVAMPSSFGLWFGAFAESLIDDVYQFESVYKVVNQNPLGSAAGYGSSFPLNRMMTTRKLGFDYPVYNVVNAQMGRGKTEKVLSFALSSLAGTIGKMAMDICLYNGQDFGFFQLPKEFTTGSSIMPHKQNPDVFELIRGKCNLLQALPGQMTHLTTNLPSGYHRDLQLLKEVLFPAIEDMKTILEVFEYAVRHLEVSEGITEQTKYDLIFTVEEVNRLVMGGMPFRDAYKHVGAQVANGSYIPQRDIHHTHEGSIGNPCFDEIDSKMKDALNFMSTIK